MKKKVVVFAGFILMTLLFTIFRCGCEKYIYDLNSIETSLKCITGTELYVDTMPDSRYFVLEDIYSQGDTVAIAYDSLAIIVKTNYSRLAAYNFYKNLPGIQSAYAYKPYVYYENITDIIITSNKDYSNQYPAGSNLKKVISVNSHGYYVYNVKTIDEMIKDISPSWEAPHLLYTFNTPPETEDVHEITIRYKTEKNQVFSAVVKNVKILK